MKTLKKIMLPALLLMLGGAAFAQQPGRNISPEDRAKQMTDRMKEQLQLDQAQYDKVYDMNLRQARKMQEARKSAQEQRKGQMDAMRAARNEREKELSAILSEDQMAKYREIQKKNADRMRRGGPGEGRRPGGGEGRKRPGPGHSKKSA